MKRTLILVGVLLGANAAHATTDVDTKAQGIQKGTWVLKVGLGNQQGRQNDAGVERVFIVGADYSLGSAGSNSNATTFLGVDGFFGSGDNGFRSQALGIHYGLAIGRGEKTPEGPLVFKVQGGYYNTHLTTGDSDDGWGMGALAAVVWIPKPHGKNPLQIEGGYFWLPCHTLKDNRGWYVAVGIPFGRQ